MLIDDLFDAIAEVPAKIIKLPTEVIKKTLEDEDE